MLILQLNQKPRRKIVIKCKCHIYKSRAHSSEYRAQPGSTRTCTRTCAHAYSYTRTHTRRNHRKQGSARIKVLVRRRNRTCMRAYLQTGSSLSFSLPITHPLPYSLSLSHSVPHCHTRAHTCTHSHSLTRWLTLRLTGSVAD